MINITNLSKRFNNIQAVNDVSFHINEGEIFSLLGPNGAGKTVIVKMITTQLLPTSGEISINGFSYKKDTKYIRNSIGVMPEIQNHYGRLSGFDNLKMFASLYGVSTSRIVDLVDMFQMNKWINNFVQTYSLGMKQKLLFARSILHNPKILFLDEPTNALDPIASENIREVIRHLNKQGTTIFLTTHYIEEAELLSDRVAIINKGEIVLIDSPSNILNKYKKTSLIVKYEDGSASNISFDELKNIKYILRDNIVVSCEISRPTLRDAYISLCREDIK